MYQSVSIFLQVWWNTCIALALVCACRAGSGSPEQPQIMVDLGAAISGHIVLAGHGLPNTLLAQYETSAQQDLEGVAGCFEGWMWGWGAGTGGSPGGRGSYPWEWKLPAPPSSTQVTHPPGRPTAEHCRCLSIYKIYLGFPVTIPAADFACTIPWHPSKPGRNVLHGAVASGCSPLPLLGSLPPIPAQL